MVLASFYSFLKFFLFILSILLLEKSGDLSSKEKDCDISQVSHLLFFWFWLKTMHRLMLGGNDIWNEFWGETCSHISRRIIKTHAFKKKKTQLPNSLGFSCSYKNIKGNYDSTYPQKQLKGRWMTWNITLLQFYNVHPRALSDVLSSHLYRLSWASVLFNALYKEWLRNPKLEDMFPTVNPLMVTNILPRAYPESIKLNGFLFSQPKSRSR